MSFSSSHVPGKTAVRSLACSGTIPAPRGLISSGFPTETQLLRMCPHPGAGSCPIPSPVSSQRSPKLSEVSLGMPLVWLLVLLIVVVPFHELSRALLSLPLCSRCPSLAEEPPAAQVCCPLLPDDLRGDDGPHRMPARGTSTSHLTWGVTTSRAPFCVFSWLGSRERETGSWGLKKIPCCT